MDALFPLAESMSGVLAEESALRYLTRPDIVFWTFVAVCAMGPVGMGLYFKSRTREEELRTIAELARAGHSTESIERLIKERKS